MMFLPILILTLSAFAQEDLDLETYCFASEVARVRVEKKLSGILVPSDKTEAEGNCLTIQMRPHRRELIQNYARNIDPDLTVKFSSAELKREPCQLLVEKIRELRKNTTTVQVSQFPGASNAQTTETSKDVMQIQTLDQFSFMAGQDVIDGKCRFITKDKYEISITARRDPKPLLPPNLPPGTIVNIQTPPEAQKTLSVSTTLQLNRGERTEIGSIVRDLRRKDQQIEIKPEAQFGNTDGQEEEKVFLSFQ